MRQIVPYESCAPPKRQCFVYSAHAPIYCYAIAYSMMLFRSLTLAFYCNGFQ